MNSKKSRKHVAPILLAAIGLSIGLGGIAYSSQSSGSQLAQALTSPSVKFDSSNNGIADVHVSLKPKQADPSFGSLVSGSVAQQQTFPTIGDKINEAVR